MDIAGHFATLDAYGSVMEIRVLGPMEIHRDGVSVSPGGLKQRTVLALLVAARGKPVSTDALIEGVYGDDAAAGARRTLATYVSNLRQTLGEVLTRSGDGYVLRTDDIDVDMVTFEQLYREAIPMLDNDPGRAATMLREALALWRGHAFVDVEARSMLDAEITHLNELRLSALDARIGADLAVGLHRDLIGELESLTAEHPYRESFRAHHMVALYRSGRQSEALRAFGRTRVLLAEELGIDPSADLRDLELAILSQDPQLDVRIKAAIETKAILAGELDDGVRYLSHRERDRALSGRDEAFGTAVADAGGTQLGVRGMAVYAAFPDVAGALAAAQTMAGGNLRLAIDHGEIELSEEATTGPPISRALRLAAVAHPGQVLLSPDSHGRLSSERSSGWSVLSLGTFDIRGVDRPLPVFQVNGAGVPASYPDLLVDRLPPPMPDRYLSGSVPGYELRTELGGGPAGAVYRAYQASIGREVSVRVIRPEVVSDPRFIRRFEATAQRIAAISHPHLVELLDYWRDPHQAFLVYRLIEGGALADTTTPPVRIVEQVGLALAAAHDAGMPHGRVRPDSVIVDREGNAYLSGLGVLSILHDLVPFPADAYTAPEVIGGDATVAGDVYSLGMLAATLFAGRQPTDGAPLSLDGRIGEVIARATHPDPAVRHDDVRQLVADLANIGDAVARSVSGPVRNPYKGLAAFQEADATDFFGRAAVVTALVDSVRENPMTLVVGPSGIGKSSVVRAGLIPALRGGALAGSEDWLITDMFPGSRPFDEMEAALARVSTRPPADQVDLLRSGRTGLIEAAAELMPEGVTLVLVVDQFEELFTQVIDEEIRRRFLDLLVEVHHTRDSPVRVVATLRADFFDRPLRNAAFGELLDDVLVTVSAPTTQELADIVTRPGRGVGLELDETLVATLVSDADGETGGLPLLQHALTELFETREGDRLTLAAYVEAGGLAGSIGRRANAIFDVLSDEDRATAREIFVRLVTVDENAEDTRRRVRIAELDGIGSSRASVERVLEAFGRHRLLVFDRDAATRGPTVEVAHEALIQHWERLGDWVDERREELLIHRRVEVATRDWVAAGRDPSFLVAGARLEQAEALGSAIGRDSEQIAFLGESRRAVDEARTRRLRNRRRVTTSLSAALALAVAFGSFGWAQRGVAEREAITARMQELAIEAEVAIDEDPDLAILLALEAYELSEQLDVERTPGEVMRALQLATQSSRVLARLPDGGLAGAFSPDGRTLLVVSSRDRSVLVAYETQTFQAVQEIQLAGPAVGIAYHPTGDLMAVFYGYPDQYPTPEQFAELPAESVSLFDASDYREVDRLEGVCRWSASGYFSPDGRWLANFGPFIEEQPSEPGYFCTEVWDMQDLSHPRHQMAESLIGMTDAGEVVVGVELGSDLGIDVEYWSLSALDRRDVTPVLRDSSSLVYIAADPVSHRVALARIAHSEVDIWDRSAAAPMRTFDVAGGFARFLPGGDRVVMGETIRQFTSATSKPAKSWHCMATRAAPSRQALHLMAIPSLSSATRVRPSYGTSRPPVRPSWAACPRPV